MHSKYWIWVSEGKKSKSWKWPAPFFQEGLAQTGLFQSFRTELLLYDERTLSLKYNHAENAWSPLPSGVRSFSWLCTKKPPSFSVWRWDELPNILRGFLLGSAYTGSLLSLSWGQPSISSFEHWGDTLLPWVLAPFPQLCSQSCSFYRPDRSGIQHIHWSWKRLYSIALDGLDGESIKIPYTTGCPSLFRLLQQNTSGWCLRNSRNLLVTPHGWVLAKALFRLLTHTGCVLTGGKGREAFSLFEETSPIHEDRAALLPKAPFPNTITWWGWRHWDFNIWICWGWQEGHTNIQSTAVEGGRKRILDLC